MKKKKDIIIASLEYAREALLQGQTISRGELSNFLVENGYIEPNDIDRKRHLIRAIYDQVFSFQDPEFSINVRLMGLDSYLGLIDHEELELAKKDSARAREESRQAIQQAEEATRLTKQALYWTKFSVILAMIVGLAQIIVTFVVK